MIQQKVDFKIFIFWGYSENLKPRISPNPEAQKNNSKPLIRMEKPKRQKWFSGNKGKKTTIVFKHSF